MLTIKISILSLPRLVYQFPGIIAKISEVHTPQT